MSLFVDFKEEKPYFFVSYSHQDSDRIAAVIQKMQEQGCNFWNDELIPAATDWDGEIAAHVSGCSGFVAFITANYVASDNCLDELNYSRDKDKPRLLIYLDKVELPEGLRMRLSRLQAVEWYRYPEETALKKVMRTDFIQNYLKECKKQETSVESSPNNETDSSSEKGNLKNSSWIRRIVLLTICAALIATGIFLSHSNRSKEISTMSAASENYHIRLQAKEDMTVKDFNTAVDTITERLNILADGETYSMSVYDDTIDLSIPRNCFGEEDPEDILRFFITRATKLYITDLQNSSYIEIPRNWISEVTVNQGKLEGVDVSDLDLGDGDYYYLAVDLVEDAVNAIQNSTMDTSQLVFAQDMTEHSKWFWYSTYAGEDPSVYYIVSSCTGEKYANLIQYNLTHEPLSEALYFTVDIDGTWENPSAVEDAGENQISVSNLDFYTPLVWEYTTTTDDLSDGEWLDTKTRFRKIMDSLEVPYVFGYDEDYSVRLKSTTDHINYDILRLILCSSSSFELQGGAERITPVSYSIQISEEGENFYLDLVLDKGNFYTSDLSRIQQLLASADEYDTPVLLTVNGIPCMTTSEPVFLDDQVLRFDLCALLGDTSVTAENQWILNFLQTLYQSKSLGITYSLKQAQIDSAAASTSQLMPGRYTNLLEESARIQSMFPNAEVTVDGTNFEIGLHAELTGMTAEEFASALTEIYRSLSSHTLYTMKVWVFCSGESGNNYSYTKGIFEPAKYVSSEETECKKPYSLTLYSSDIFGENSAERIVDQLRSDPTFEDCYISSVE